MKIQLKFKASASERSKDRVAAQLKRRGADRVRPLFPGDEDEEFSLLHVVDCEDQDVADKLLRYLKRSRAVEFAEGEARRRLIK
ncbi:MAG: hypothetical protein AAF430_01375 [Myxococcota bacterium]